MRTLEKIISKQFKIILYYCPLYRLTGDDSNLADFKLMNFCRLFIKKQQYLKSLKLQPFMSTFFFNCQLVWFERAEWSKNRYVGFFFRNCYVPLNFLCRSAVAHLYVWLTFAPWKCYQNCNQANSRADGQCQYRCFWSGCLMRSESVTWASFILSVSHGRYTWCKCSGCSRSQIHQSKESPSH